MREFGVMCLFFAILALFCGYKDHEERLKKLEQRQKLKEERIILQLLRDAELNPEIFH